MKRLWIVLAAALLATPAGAQQGPSFPFPLPRGNSQATNFAVIGCLDSKGNAVPTSLCDQWPSVAPSGQAATKNGIAGIVTLSPNSGASQPYPAGAIGLTETNTGTTAGTTATFPAVQNKTNWLCGFSVSPGSASTAITITITTTGLTNNFTLSVGAPVTAVGTTGTTITVPISPCVPASAVNTAITVVAGALSTGGVGQSVNAWGFIQ